MSERLSTSAAVLFAAALLFSAGASAEPPRRLKVAVLDFEAHGASKELATAATALAANELQGTGAFDVVTSDALQSVIALERQKQLLGCSDDQASCLAEMAGALGVDRIVIGRVTRVEGAPGGPATFTLDLSLVDARVARREGSVVERAANEAELLGKVSGAVTRLVSPLLNAAPAFLLVSSSEAGAVVKVDGTIVGTTPIEGRLQLAPGTHLVELEKEGFITARKQLKLAPDEALEHAVTLVPNADFIARYESRESKLRLGALVATGVAAAGVLGAGYFQWQADRLYGPAEREGTFLFHRAKVTDGVTEEGDREHWTKANALRTQIGRNETLSWVAGGVGAAAGLGAAALWIIGDDPDRYARFRTVKVSGYLTPGAGGVAVGGAF